MPTAVDVARVFLGREYDGLAIELVVLSLAVFLLRYAVVLYASHLVASLSGLHAAVVGDGSSPGLDGAAIARLPCFVLVRRGGGDDGDATADYCAVCLGAVEEGETVRALPCCRHAFHARCLEPGCACGRRAPCAGGRAGDTDGHGGEVEYISSRPQVSRCSGENVFV